MIVGGEPPGGWVNGPVASRRGRKKQNNLNKLLKASGHDGKYHLDPLTMQMKRDPSVKALITDLRKTGFFSRMQDTVSQVPKSGMFVEGLSQPRAAPALQSLLQSSSNTFLHGAGIGFSDVPSTGLPRTKFNIFKPGPAETGFVSVQPGGRQEGYNSVFSTMPPPLAKSMQQREFGAPSDAGDGKFDHLGLEAPAGRRMSLMSERSLLASGKPAAAAKIEVSAGAAQSPFELFAAGAAEREAQEQESKRKDKYQALKSHVLSPPQRPASQGDPQTTSPSKPPEVVPVPAAASSPPKPASPVPEEKKGKPGPLPSIHEVSKNLGGDIGEYQEEMKSRGFLGQKLRSGSGHPAGFIVRDDKGKVTYVLGRENLAKQLNIQVPKDLYYGQNISSNSKYEVIPAVGTGYKPANLPHA